MIENALRAIYETFLLHYSSPAHLLGELAEMAKKC